MSDNTVVVSRPEPAVALITLNRPEKRNAMNLPTFEALDGRLTELERDPSVSAVILTGAGPVFSAGYDVREMSGLDEAGTMLDYQRREPWMWHLANLSKPLVAALNGPAYGGGAVMAMCADIRIGCPASSFRVTAVPYGGLNATWNLPLIVGWGRAKEWLLTGRVVSSEEALTAGLLNHLVDEREVLPRSIEMAAAIASNPSAASRALKTVVHENVGRRFIDAYAAENAMIHAQLKPGRTDELFRSFLNR